MTLFGGRRVTKSPSHKSHGLQDIYEVPISPLRGSSPPITDHSPRPLRVGRTNGQKRAKPALRVSRKSDSSKLRYKQTINNSGMIHDHEREELAPRRQNFLQDDEQIHSTPDSRACEIEPQLGGMPEVARERLIEMALEGLFVTGDLSSVENGGGNASSVRVRKKTVIREATLPVQYPAAKILNKKDSNTASTSFETCVENEESCNMQHQEAHISTLEEGRLANEKDVPVPILCNATAASESLSASQIEVFDMNISPKASGPVGGRLSNECGQNIDVVARANVPYPASLLDTAVEFRNQNNTKAQMPQIFAEAFSADIGKPSDDASDELDVHAIDTSITNADIESDERQIEAIEDLRMNEDGHTDFLVKWDGIDYELATWEHEEAVISLAPRLLVQYLKGMIFADSRIEKAEGDKQLERNQLSTDRFPENDAGMLGNNGPVENDNPMKDSQGIGHDDTIEDSQSFGEDESAGDEQLLRFEPALEYDLLGAAKPSVRKRGRGRPRKSDKSTLTTRVSRQTTTVTVDHFEMPGVSMMDGFRQASNVSMESQSRLSQSDFSMPSAEEVLEAAKELALSRKRRKSVTLDIRRRQQHLVKHQKPSLSISSNEPAKNPYKKYYLTGQSNRRLKSQRAVRSQLRGAPRGVRPPPKLTTTEIKEASEKLIPGNTVVRGRRGRPPGSRNKNTRPAQIQPRSSSAGLRSGGIRKRRPGQPRVSRSKNNLLSSLRPSRGSKGEPDRGRGRLRASRGRATLIELDSIFNQISNLSRL